MSGKEPTISGYYWAQWRIADAAIDKMYDYTPSRVWEVVEVCLDYDEQKTLVVHIPGVPGHQPVENFYWGQSPVPLDPPPSTIKSHQQDSVEEAARRYRKMTPAEREQFYQDNRLAVAK